MPIAGSWNAAPGCTLAHLVTLEGEETDGGHREHPHPEMYGCPIIHEHYMIDEVVPPAGPPSYRVPLEGGRWVEAFTCRENHENETRNVEAPGGWVGDAPRDHYHFERFATVTMQQGTFEAATRHPSVSPSGFGYWPINSMVPPSADRLREQRAPWTFRRAYADAVADGSAHLGDPEQQVDEPVDAEPKDGPRTASLTITDHLLGDHILSLEITGTPEIVRRVIAFATDHALGEMD